MEIVDCALYRIRDEAQTLLVYLTQHPTKQELGCVTKFAWYYTPVPDGRVYLFITEETYGRCN